MCCALTFDIIFNYIVHHVLLFLDINSLILEYAQDICCFLVTGSDKCNDQFIYLDLQISAATPDNI